MYGAILDIGRGVTRWRTWWLMGMQDIELRYRRSILGPFWLSASVVCLILGLAYIYSAIFKTEFREFLAHLATGYFAWVLIVSLVTEGGNCVIEHATQISNVPMPLTVAAGRVMLRNLVIFLHNGVAVLALLFLFGVHPQAQGWRAVAGAAVIFFAGYCMALILGPLCARFRDINQLLQSVMQIAFFVTPIMWTPEHAAGRPLILAANPFYHLVELVRAPLLGRYPTEQNWTISLIVCGIVAVLAFFSLAATRRRLTLWL